MSPTALEIRRRYALGLPLWDETIPYPPSVYGNRPLIEEQAHVFAEMKRVAEERQRSGK